MAYNQSMSILNSDLKHQHYLTKIKAIFLHTTNYFQDIFGHSSHIFGMVQTWGKTPVNHISVTLRSVGLEASNMFIESHFSDFIFNPVNFYIINGPELVVFLTLDWLNR